MTAGILSFEPVHVDGCTLAPTTSMARTMRFKELGVARGRQPVGTTVDVSCGNPLCYAATQRRVAVCCDNQMTKKRYQSDNLPPATALA